MSHDDHDHDHDHDHGDERDQAGQGRAAAAPPVDPRRYEGIEGIVVRETSPSARELLAVLPHERFERAVEKEASTLARKVHLKGFRPGKAPVARVRTLYADEIRERAVQALVNGAWNEVQEREALRPVAAPVLTEISVDAGQPVRFAAEFEVLPHVRLQALDEVKATPRTVKITDADVDEEVDALRSLHARLEESSKDEAGPGDFVVVDLQRFAPGADTSSDPPEETQEMVVQVGSDRIPPEMDRVLLGMGVGEIRKFETSSPAAAGGAPEQRSFRVLLKGVRDRILPELTDEWVSGQLGAGSVQELRDALRQRLREQRLQEARRQQDGEVVEQLLARNPIEMPRSLVDREAEARIKSGLMDLARRGVDVRSLEVDWKSEMARARESAERSLRADWLLELVARERGVEVSDEEVEAEIIDMAKRRRTTPEALRMDLEKSKQVSNLEASMRRRRVLDLLESGATISVE